MHRIILGLLVALLLATDARADPLWPKGASGTTLVARGDRVSCRSYGFSDRARRIRARCDTVYDIGSMTKQFTAAAIVKLEMLGKLRVSDRLSDHLGPVPADKRDITLHQLLTHTAGFFHDLGHDYDVLSRDEMLRRALASKPRARPCHAYSNLGYSILAAVVEKASGMGYERFLARHLFAPAGMTQTGYVLPRFRRERVAVEYDRRGVAHGRPFEHPWAADGPYWNLRGNGGILSTARDMLRWHRALLGDTILSAAAKRKLFAPHVSEGGGSHYGYGWEVLRVGGRRVVTHNGGNGWSLGRIAHFPASGTLVFWISNHHRRDGRWNLERRETRLTLGLARTYVSLR